MTAPVSQQVDGLRALVKRLSAKQLVRSGAVARDSEAQHLIDMMRDAADTLEQNEHRLD